MSWKILGEVNHNKRIQLRVQCSCGKVEIRRKDHVRDGRTKSCKRCSTILTLKVHPNQKFGPKPHYGLGDISKTYWSGIKFGAVRRGIKFEISLSYAWSLFLKQKATCALSGVSISLKHGYKQSNVDWSTITGSLDRIDSDKGYIEGNVQWVHKVVNYIKRDLNEAEFIYWCKQIGARG
jgi:hypothetical protein